MTNAEKYKEVFGFEHDLCCPTLFCNNCPMGELCSHNMHDEVNAIWWNSEYKDTHVEEDYSEFSE